MDILGAGTTAADVEAACRGAVDDWRARVSAIGAAVGARNAENTLRPLDRLRRDALGLLSSVALLRSVHPEPDVRRAAERGEAAIDAFLNDLALDRGVYEAVRSVDVAALDDDARRLVGRLLRDFRRAGVDRDDAVRAKVLALRQEIMSIGQEFHRNIASDVRSIVLTGPQDLDGLPEDYVREHAAAEDGTIRITTDYPDCAPFMIYSKRGDLRQRLYTEFRRRAYPRNLQVLDRLLRLRRELAGALGHATWASYAAEDKMVKSPEAIAEFLERVSSLARPRAAWEYGVLLEEKRREEPDAERVHDWEKAYYESLVRLRRFRVDGKKVREYFEFPRVRDGIVGLVEDLFGLRFEVSRSAPRWHPDVEVLDVFERADAGARIGRVYLDMHPRDGKFKHAAMFPLRRGGKGVACPEAALVCNFPDPRKCSGPALLEHEDVVTFFHEFGHLIHHLFACRSEWVELSGLSTEWDFVEVPSQLFEEWAWDHEVLRRFAVHGSTGDTIPEALVAELRRAREFGQALAACHQIFYAVLSLRCHVDDPCTLDLNRLVAELQNRYSFFRFVDDTHFLASFGHLDGYSSLYYTYMWSRVIEKDLYREFAGRGLMDRDTARRFRDIVLAPGGTRDAADLVRGFLGREYSFEAFERWLGGEAN